MIRTLTVTTTEDFREQTARNGEEETIKNPTRPVDKRFEELVRNPLYDVHPEFDGVQTLYRADNGYPNATFAHYFLGKTLRNQHVSPEVHVDMGCGLGFIGNYSATHLEPRAVIFADLNPAGLAQSIESIMINGKINPRDVETFVQNNGSVFGMINGDRQILALLGDVKETLQNVKADIATAAPMYIPGICEVFPQAYHIFAHMARHIGATMYFGHSNLASDVVEDAAKKTGMKREEIAMQRLPLQFEYADVRPHTLVQRDMEFLFGDVERLLVQRGLEVSEDPDLPRYYHKIVVSKLSPPQSEGTRAYS